MNKQGPCSKHAHHGFLPACLPAWLFACLPACLPASHTRHLLTFLMVRQHLAHHMKLRAQIQTLTAPNTSSSSKQRPLCVVYMLFMARNFLNSLVLQTQRILTILTCTCSTPTMGTCDGHMISTLAHVCDHMRRVVLWRVQTSRFCCSDTVKACH